jgi:hypothetical protein
MQTTFTACRKGGSDKPVMVRAMTMDVVLFNSHLQEAGAGGTVSGLPLAQLAKAGEGQRGKDRLKAVLLALRAAAEDDSRVRLRVIVRITVDVDHQYIAISALRTLPASVPWGAACEWCAK